LVLTLFLRFRHIVRPRLDGYFRVLNGSGPTATGPGGGDTVNGNQESLFYPPPEEPNMKQVHQVFFGVLPDRYAGK
jgi:hypothetical protein